MEEHCELCGEPILPAHQHLLDMSSRELTCTCRACALLFDRRAASEGRYRLVPDRRLRIEDFELDDGVWESLRIPVEMAFFLHWTGADRMMAFYPSPMGATECLLELRAWEDLVTANPVLGDMEPDVETLLVNRARGAREYYLAPIDDCFDLVGLIRTNWRGLGGGREVWKEIDGFFERLAGRSRRAARDGTVHRKRPPEAEASGEREETAWLTT